MNESQKSIVSACKIYVTNLLQNDCSGHDQYHAFRVYHKAQVLAKALGADEFIVALAALLHDVDDYKISKNTNHAITFLEKYNVNETKEIMNIIETISFSSHLAGKIVSTLNGKIVQDADRLDALGAIGIARCFAYSGFAKRPMYQGKRDDDSSVAHFYQKLFKLPDLMNTEPAKELAKKQARYMKNFLAEFYKEWGDNIERI